MEVQVIYSFEDSPQIISEMPTTAVIIKSRKMFFLHITQNLSDQEKKTLVKISCCIYNAAKLELSENHWYNKANGKFWDCDIIPLMKDIYNIECTYEPINP